MPDKEKLKQLQELKSKVKDPTVKKAIEEKMKYVNKPLNK